MSVVNEFTRGLASLFSLDAAEIDLSAESVSIGGTMLAQPGPFDFRGFLESANARVIDTTCVAITTAEKTLTLYRATLRGKTESGIIEIPGCDAWVFLGSFGTSPNIDLAKYKELLIAVCFFQPRSSSLPTRDWPSIIEAVGPVVGSTLQPPEEGLAEIGCFLGPEGVNRLSYELPSQARVFSRRSSVPTEAFAAYIEALKGGDGFDVAFLRFYRIFELHFAAAIQNEIAGAPLRQVYEKIRRMQGASELDILRRTLDNSRVSFSRFTASDFEALFGLGYKPKAEQYRAIVRWLENNPPTTVPENCRAQIIYYVRCALVHSKLSDTEPFLFGPFEGARASALQNLVDDTRAIIRDLLST